MASFRRPMQSNTQVVEIVFYKLTNPSGDVPPYEARVPQWIYGSLALFSVTTGLFFLWTSETLKPSLPFAYLCDGIAGLTSVSFVASVWRAITRGEINLRIDTRGVFGRHRNLRWKLIDWETVSQVGITMSQYTSRSPTRRVYVMDRDKNEVLIVTLALGSDFEYRLLIDYLRSILNEDERPQWSPKPQG